MKWILEKDVGDSLGFTEVLKTKNLPFVISEHYAFQNERDLFKLWPYTNEVFAYGSIGFCRKIAKCGYNPGPYANFKQFECSYYYPKFGKHLLNSDYVMLPFGELNRRKWFLIEMFGPDMFIRPNGGTKQFTGQVLSETNWSSSLELLGWYDTPDDAIVVIASPQKIDAEYRVVMKGKEPITGSQYSSWEERYLRGEEKERRLCENDSLFDYVRSVMKEVNYFPDPVWVLDIVRQNETYSVLEVGAISCAGLYGCDLNKIVDAIEETALEDSVANKETP